MTSEFKRKAFHLLSLGFFALYAVGGRARTAGIVAGLWGIVAVGEALRLRNPAFNRWVLVRFNGIYRESESTKPSGILWMLSGAVLLVSLTPDVDVVMAALAWCHHSSCQMWKYYAPGVASSRSW